MPVLNNVHDNKIDVVIPYHDKDREIIEMCITGCFSNIHNLGNLYVVAKNIDQRFGRVRLIDEDKLFEGVLCKKYIESRLRTEHPDLLWRAGWLFQQFIKIGCSYAIPNLTNYYLVVDSDVVFLKKIYFFTDGKMLLTKAREFHQPYFDCYERLLGDSANREYSFIAHHMLICKPIMLEMLNKIEGRFNKTWYDSILDNIDNKEGSMFSEYETYGHYLKNHYPEAFVVRQLRNIQRFRIRYLLKILFNQVDYVTIHSYKKPENNPKVPPLIYKLFLGLVRNKVNRQKVKTMT